MGGTPAAHIYTLRNYKRFLREYSITFRLPVPFSPSPWRCLLFISNIYLRLYTITKQAGHIMSLVGSIAVVVNATFSLNNFFVNAAECD
jgi:hypothetical protein